jgi:hypothetical protein
MHIISDVWYHRLRIASSQTDEVKKGSCAENSELGSSIGPSYITVTQT